MIKIQSVKVQVINYTCLTFISSTLTSATPSFPSIVTTIPCFASHPAPSIALAKPTTVGDS